MSTQHDTAAGAPLPSNTAWRRAGLLALAALACALMLGGLSAWFLGSVGLAGLTAAAFVFNFHVPGALIRLLAVGRTAAKYGERLLGHKAALADQVARRTNLFAAMAAAPAVRQKGWQLGDEARLADWLDDVEDLDYARLRIDMPAVATGAGLLALVAATAWIAPLALVATGLLILAMLTPGGGLARAGAMAWEHRRQLQREGAQRLGMAMASAIPLRAEGDWGTTSAEALARLSEAEATTLSTARRQAGLDAMGGLIGPAGLLSVVGAAYWSGARGEDLLIPVFLGFGWLTFGETLHGLSRIVVARFRRDAARGEIAGWTGTPAASVPATAVRPTRMTFSDVPRIAPDGRVIGEPVTLELEAGRPLVLTGPSGCGKTSLLKQVAGWITEDTACAGTTVLSAAARRHSAFFCPHDAAILSDTFRANLFAPAANDDDIHSALEKVELTERVEQAGGLDAWVTQGQLSLGEAQRFNLARAFLTDKPIVLLDEPTEHLDHDQGRRILDRLSRHLADRVVVICSHREIAVAGLQSFRL